MGESKNHAELTQEVKNTTEESEGKGLELHLLLTIAVFGVENTILQLCKSSLLHTIFFRCHVELDLLNNDNDPGYEEVSNGVEELSSNTPSGDHA